MRKLDPASHWLNLVNLTMVRHHCSNHDAWKVAGIEYPDAATLMTAWGQTGKTVQFFNAKEAGKTTPEQMEKRKQLVSFVNANTRAGLHPALALQKAQREHPELISGARFIKVVLPGELGQRATGNKQFANDGATPPVGSPQMKFLLYLDAGTTQEEFDAAWEANGATMSVINPAKIFDGLCKLAQKKYGLTYDQAIARCKKDYSRLWDAVELLSKEKM